MNTTSTSCPVASLQVDDLHSDVTEAMLFEKFSTCGPVLSVHVYRYVISNKTSLCYANVNFQRREDAQRAMDTMNFDRIKGYPIRIKWRKDDTSSKDMNLYVKNLDGIIDDERLHQEFSQFGTITSAKVMRNDYTDKSKGFGFVCFSSSEEATKAIIKMNGHTIENKQLYVALAQPKKERQALLALAQEQRQKVQCKPTFQAGYFVPTMPQAKPFFFPRPNIPATTRQACGQLESHVRPNLLAVDPGQDPSDPLTASMLVAALPHKQKQMLGERLFPLIQRIHSELAGKITGMLLETDHLELLCMLESHEDLKLKVDEAVAVLQAH